MVIGDSRQWLVPVTVSTASSPDEAVHKFVLNSREESVTIDGVKPTDWLKVGGCQWSTVALFLAVIVLVAISNRCDTAPR